ncbi:MAG: topoisomerase [Bryobacterales bacterium]|jgi:DNA topoisomerase-1|nr:topoisomerase [Bryobacterales bacterium]
MTFRPLPVDPKKSAILAGLRYVRCDSAGFTRRAAGKGFSYIDLDGRPIRDKETLRRIRSLVIPPAWKNVWICSLEHGHLQATGVDARGRRQYRYHPNYRQIRNQTKFHRMLAFAKALPAIRESVEQDLKLPGLPREKVIATVVRLLETTFIRIGNEEYAKQNASFGLTTLHNRHVKIEGSTIRFSFRGKSAQDHDITVQDKRLARIVRDCRDLPGYDLFQYVDHLGQTRSIDSSDVNEYLREACGEDFTAKDFRTWAGTVQTALALAEIGPFSSETEAKRIIAAAIKNTASRLGNRPATCRNYYVHPAVTDGYLDGTLLKVVRPPDETDEAAASTDLHPEERAVVKLLQGWRR